MKKQILGFTLIELLVVIVIIGILAIAFLPSVMNAPSRARDAARIADLTDLAKSIELGRAYGVSLPTSLKCVTDANFSAFTSYFKDGTAPKDPDSAADLKYSAGNSSYGCIGQYIFFIPPSGITTYKFAVFSKIENPAQYGNFPCKTNAPYQVYSVAFQKPSNNTTCYGVKVSM